MSNLFKIFLLITSLLLLCACVGSEHSESSSSGYKEEAWYEGAGFFYLDKIIFEQEGQESAFSTKRKNTSNFRR